MPFPVSRRQFVRAALGLMTASAPLAKQSTGQKVSAFRSAIEAMLPELMQRHRIPGVAVAVIHDRRILWTNAFAGEPRRNVSTRSEGDKEISWGLGWGLGRVPSGE